MILLFGLWPKFWCSRGKSTNVIWSILLSLIDKCCYVKGTRMSYCSPIGSLHICEVWMKANETIEIHYNWWITVKAFLWDNWNSFHKIHTCFWRRYPWSLTLNKYSVWYNKTFDLFDQRRVTFDDLEPIMRQSYNIFLHTFFSSKNIIC